jgi:hypothetical protein
MCKGNAITERLSQMIELMKDLSLLVLFTSGFCNVSAIFSR